MRSTINNDRFKYPKSLKTLLLNESVTIPSNANNIYIVMSINSYYYAPLMIVPDFGQFITIPFTVPTWVGVIVARYDRTNNVISFNDEKTIAGNKAGTWTTEMRVFYD